MRRNFSPIVLLGGESDPPDWLVQGAPHGTPVLCSTRIAEARELVEHGTSRLLLCAPQDAAGHDTGSLLEQIVRGLPHVATVGMASRLRGDPNDMLRLARSGVHALLFEEDRRVPLLVRRALTEAATRCRNQHVWGNIAPLTPDRVRPMVSYGLLHAHEALTVDGVAHALGLHRKTLAERCALAGTLPPQLLLGWCRLLAAAALLEDRARPVDHIAIELDFPSGAAFRNMLKRYTGLTPAQLRAKGTIAEMSRRFRKAMMTGTWTDAASRAS